MRGQHVRTNPAECPRNSYTDVRFHGEDGNHKVMTERKESKKEAMGITVTAMATT